MNCTKRSMEIRFSRGDVGSFNLHRTKGINWLTLNKLIHNAFHGCSQTQIVFFVVALQNRQGIKSE